VDDRDVVYGGGGVREVASVERDERLGITAHRRSQYVPILRITGHAPDEGLVAADLRIRERPAHLPDPVSDCLFRQSALQQVTLQLIQHPSRPQRPVGTRLGKTQQRVA
jgi:hypothetical protein